MQGLETNKQKNVICISMDINKNLPLLETLKHTVGNKVLLLVT